MAFLFRIKGGFIMKKVFMAVLMMLTLTFGIAYGKDNSLEDIKKKDILLWG